MAVMRPLPKVAVAGWGVGCEMADSGAVVVLVGVGMGIVVLEFESNGRSGNSELNPPELSTGRGPDGRNAR